MTNPAQANQPEARSDDMNARHRIVDAALTAFADAGVAATSLKTIAARAGVSPALIIHHYGSKDALREACDHHVAAIIRQSKLSAMQQLSYDPLHALRTVPELRPMLRYLARTLGDGRPQVRAIVDEMIEDAHEYMAEGERAGIVKPSAYPRDRTAILVLWSLGLTALSEHVSRHLDLDMFDADTASLERYLLPVTEMLVHGVLAEGFDEQLHAAFAQLREDGDNADEGTDQS